MTIKAQREFLHDISTPLSTAILYLEVLSEQLKATPNNDKNIELIKKINSSLEKLGSLVKERRSWLISEELKKSNQNN